MKMYNPVNFLRMIFDKTCHFIIFLCRKPYFAEYHYSDTIIRPIMISPKFIEIKESVRIYHHARIEGISQYRGKYFNPKIVLNRGVSIQQNLHLTCANSVTIGENTAIAANVTITDINHLYLDIEKPVELQDIEVKAVEIGADCKIYNNTVILPGTKIGKHVTVGANSIVGGIIPDFCVIAGAPAYIIKRYDKTSKRWRKTDKNGNFEKKD